MKAMEAKLFVFVFSYLQAEAFGSASEPVIASCTGQQSSACAADDAAFIQRHARPELAPHLVQQKHEGRVGPPFAGHPDYIPVPHGGFHHKSCIIEVPSGTKRSPHPDMEDRHVLHFPNGTNMTLEPCKYETSGLAHLRQHAESLVQGASTDGMGLRSSDCVLSDGQVSSGPLAMYGSNLDSPMQSFTSEASVPGNPSTTLPSDTWLYWWIGAMPSNYEVVLQPVLAYHQAVGWEIGSWDCCPSGHQIKSAFTQNLETNEEITMSVTQTGSQSYKVSACTQFNQCSTLEATNGDDIVVPLVQFETYNVAVPSSCVGSSCTEVNCDYLPTSALVMNKLQVSPGTTWESPSSRCWSLSANCHWSIEQYTTGYTEPALWATPPPPPR